MNDNMNQIGWESSGVCMKGQRGQVGLGYLDWVKDGL